MKDDSKMSFSEFVGTYFSSLKMSSFHKDFINSVENDIRNSPDGTKEIILAGGRTRGIHANVCIVDGMIMTEKRDPLLKIP